MNRIDQKFETLKRDRKKAFIAYITAGFPNLSVTEDLVAGFDQAGVDIVEIGIPFSDPLADGPTIQHSSQKALDRGVTLEKIFKSVSKIRKRTDIPIALMTYYNPVFHYGEDKFVKRVKQVGADGLIIPDLPPEEAGKLIKAAKKSEVSLVFFLSPTTQKNRIKKVAQSSTGFIYFVSLTGVTGARQALPTELKKQVKAAKRITKKPICVGFGISSPAQVKLVAKISDGVIVGSAIIKMIEKNIGKKELKKNVLSGVKRLAKVI